MSKSTLDYLCLIISVIEMVESRASFQVAALLSLVVSGIAAERSATLLLNENGTYVFKEGLVDSSHALAWGIFENKINTTGWSYLELNTSRRFSDEKQVS